MFRHQAARLRRSLRAAPLLAGFHPQCWKGLTTLSVHCSEVTDSTTGTGFCLIRLTRLGERSTATDLFRAFPGGVRDDGSRAFPGSSPHWERLLRRRQGLAFRIPALLHSARGVGGFRLLPGRCRPRKDDRLRVSPEGQPPVSCASRPLERRFGTGLQKGWIKEQGRQEKWKRTSRHEAGFRRTLP